MNVNTAQDILNIQIPYSKNKLKKAYMNAALKYHPDKSKNPDANIIFNNVTQAYHFLNDLLDNNIINEEDKNNEDNSYFSLISQFFSMAFISNDSIDPTQIDTLINSFKNDCKEFSLKVIEDFNPETLFKLWDYIIRFKDLFNLDRNFIMEIVLDIYPPKENSVEICDIRLEILDKDKDKKEEIVNSNIDNNGKLRIFISYSSKYNKEIAGILKKLFEEYDNIECFVAHDDIIHGSEWEKEIIKNLDSTNLFMPIQTKHLESSYWCQQE